MCCCQLASAVAHLLPALTSSCLCFVALKQGPDSGPKNGATILKLAAELPNVWSQFWAHGVCVLLLGHVPSEYHGYVLLSACVGSSTLAARID